MPSANFQLIKAAIIANRPISASYKQEPGRKLCPFVAGFTAQHEEVVLCYQYGGFAQEPLGPAGSKKNWRCFKVALLKNVQQLNEPFPAVPNYPGQGQKSVTHVDTKR